MLLSAGGGVVPWFEHYRNNIAYEIKTVEVCGKIFNMHQGQTRHVRINRTRAIDFLTGGFSVGKERF